MPRLLELLKTYSEDGHVPMHMPGHKRSLPLLSDYTIDVTEIEGFDNLHSPKGILKECLDYASSVYGSKETFFSVNGSTCALHAAIHATTNYGDKILVARNCHQSVYNIITLRGLVPHYIYAENKTSQAEEVKELLDQNPDIKVVVITSPSYDGTTSKIEEIAEICHVQGAVLIVDEAHGAHLPFAEKAGRGSYFTRSAISQGADIVVQSLHKTLPAMTQTAGLHRMSDRVSGEKIRKAFSIFETSSPSYVLMASIDECIHYVQDNCKKLFTDYGKRLKGFYETAAEEFPNLFEKERLAEGIETRPFKHYDPSKILICGKNLSMTGKEIYDILVNDYGIMPEMSAGEFCLCMTSVCDTDESFSKLINALREIYQSRCGGSIQGDLSEIPPELFCQVRTEQFCTLTEAEGYNKFKLGLKQLYSILADDSNSTAQRTGQANTRCVAAELVSVYPPGVPLLVPGEYITKENVEYIMKALKAGNEVYGVHDDCIYVLSEE